MPTETLLANGFDLLNNNPYCVPDLSSLLAGPGRRTSNITVAQRDGAVRVPNKLYSTNAIPLELWIKGLNADGSVPADRTSKFYSNVDAMLELFSTETVSLVHGLPDGSQRQISTEMLEAIDFTRFPHRRSSLGKLVVVLEAWESFWADVADQNDSITSVAGASTNKVLTAFAGATAPMKKLLVTIAGACINPIVTAGPWWFRYTDTIPSGQSLVVNTETWELTGTGGLVVDYTKLTHAGIGPIFALPHASGGPLVNYDHTGTTDSTVTIAGKRRYLGG